MSLSPSLNDIKQGLQPKKFGENAKIIVDSGTSYFLMPSKNRDEFLEYLEQSRQIICNNDNIPRCYCDQ
jgi:hypothetical protein